MIHFIEGDSIIQRIYGLLHVNVLSNEEYFCSSQWMLLYFLLKKLHALNEPLIAVLFILKLEQSSCFTLTLQR